MAMGWSENLPVPRMLMIVPRGLVGGLLKENSFPSSVPASYGYRATCRSDIHCPSLSSSDKPETPTNQSGLGPIIDTKVISG